MEGRPDLWQETFFLENNEPRCRPPAGWCAARGVGALCRRHMRRDNCAPRETQRRPLEMHASGVGSSPRKVAAKSWPTWVCTNRY